MPRLLSFTIKNFRGIQETTIKIDEKSQSDVITLIGLNESGKTTVLEALSHFSTGDRTIPNLLAQVENQDHLLSLIPITQRSNFNGSVSISADIHLDHLEMEKYCRKTTKETAYDLVALEGDRKIQVTKTFKFSDSKYVDQSNYWYGVPFNIKKKSGKIISNIQSK